LKNEKGKMEMVWLPLGLYEIVEETRKKLGMNKSAFYRYAIVRLLEELNVLTKTVHEPEKKLPVVPA